MTSKALTKRIPFIGGNWKSFSILEKVKNQTNDLKNINIPNKTEIDVVVSPTALYLNMVKEEQKGANQKVAAQNCSATDEGAYTGEISAEGLSSSGIEYVIQGHSERRTQYNETNEIILNKVQKSQKNSQKVILCIGETLEESKNNKTQEILKEQITNIYKDIPKDKYNDIVIAYEPVWAIGTGLSATPEKAQENHRFIRSILEEFIDKEVAQNTRIIYGGSVNPTNASEQIIQEDIDGFLIGGASLVAEKFSAILDIVSSKVVM